MSDAIISTAQALKASRIADHEARNAQSKADAQTRRDNRIAGHQARNADSRAEAKEAKTDRSEFHREWNAEEHYAAVAMRAMKKAQPSLAVTVAANDDTADLAKAA